MAERQNTSSRSSGGKKAPPRRNDVIHCENCGEDYAVTYKRCPFCDERPGRGPNGRRVANSRGGGYGAPANPLQIAMVVGSLIIIIAALFIVFKFISGPLFSRSSNSGDSSTSTSQGSDVSSQGGSSSDQSSDVSTPSGDSSDDTTQTPAVSIQSVTLSKSDITLPYGDTAQLTATITPANTGAAVTWTSSDTSVLSVDENGVVSNKNSGSSTVAVTVTASCGDVSAQCIVRCKPQSGGSTGTTTTGTVGTIVNAEDGLNIRSGPGRDYDVVASAPNGATVTIQGEENGWYKIVYSGTGTGYVSKDYVSVG